MEAMDEMRIGDADRERAVERLREHAAAGRLTVDELEQRSEEAYAARTEGELRTVLRELPGEPRRPARPRRGAAAPGDRLRRAPRLLGLAPVPLMVLAAGVIAAIVLSGGHLWWIVFPAWFVFAKRSHGHRFGCGSRRPRHSRTSEPDTVVV